MNIGHSIYNSIVYSIQYVLRRGVENDAEACPADGEISFPFRREYVPIAECHPKDGNSTQREERYTYAYL
jgi:hypothetical protein